MTEVQAEWRMVNMDEWSAEQAANLARMVALKDELIAVEEGRLAAQRERDDAHRERADARREEADGLYVRVAALNSASCFLSGSEASEVEVFRLAEKFAGWLAKAPS